MIVVLSGTNRPGSNTRKVAELCRRLLEDAGAEVRMVDLAQLPAELFDPSSYAAKPATFAPFQEAILAADGVLTVVPEYNGSFPGVLKYFLDMLRFPDSLYEKPAGFIGVAAGRWGALRAVEQLEMIFQYRHAHLFGRRCFLPGIDDLLGAEGELLEDDTAAMLANTVRGFAAFCRALSPTT
jgi:NAD(P)H-dependent FMN reductase